MKKFKDHHLEGVKNAIKANYSNYESLLELSANLLLSINDVEKVLHELSKNNMSTDVLSVSKDGKEKWITQSNWSLRVLSSLGNEFAQEALLKILPNLEKGQKFKTKRIKGAISYHNKYIHKLATDYPDLSAKELEKIADKNIVPVTMKSTSFANQVTIGRKYKN